MSKPEFKVDVSAWERVLGKTRIPKDAKALFVGVHEGRAPLWLLENVAPKARVTVVASFD